MKMRSGTILRNSDMKMNITIEDISKMKKHDLTLFINVWKKSFKDDSFPISINNMNKTQILVVRDENGKVVGGSILSRWIHDLCVDPEQQGKGIGRMILKYLQKQGNIILQMDKESEHLKSFYMKNGMVKSHNSYDSLYRRTHTHLAHIARITRTRVHAHTHARASEGCFILYF